MERLTTTASDDELLRLLRAGDEQAFITLYRRRQGGIFRFALRMSGSETVAEDVTQEVFLTLMREVGHYDAARGSLTAYLYGIARNQVLRRLERDRAFVPLSEGENEDEGFTTAGLIVAADPLTDLTRNETVAAVRQAVLGLPAHYREVVVLCDLQELSYAETAAALGCAVGTVRSRLHRGRALLVERLRVLAVPEAAPDVKAARCLI